MGYEPLEDTEPREPTQHTAAANAAAAVGLELDEADFERASRGHVAQHPTGVIEAAHGVVWDVHRHDFLREQEQAPDSVHPSLWRQARLNTPHGLFEVADGMWQARGYDISNITFLRGEKGWVIIDPLTTEHTAAACLQLANDHLGERPVTAVIYTHSHADHFGGAYGVTSTAAVDAGDVRIIAPEGFLREAVAENIIAGPAMARRVAYQFGPMLPAGPLGHVDCGLGKAIPLAQPGLLAPTEDVSQTGQELTVDGIRIVFQNTPDAEAPAEMNFFFPDCGWLCMAENCTHNMHNLVPMRGALVRDSLNWSKYIGEARELFGGDTEVMFASHHWPRWGNADVDEFLRRQRDMYRWIHDQTMRLAGHGHTPNEIAEMLQLPPEFMEEGHTRGYYGSLVHNIKAVYTRYLSWYDGNPAHLWAHPPSEAGARYVKLAGGPEALLANARAAFDSGDYRWVTEVVNHLVFAQPENSDARALQADALEQLGYQAESATVRNSYLTGARELRHGPPKPRVADRRHMIGALTMDQIFDTLAVRLNSDDVGGKKATVNWHFTDLVDTDAEEDWILGLEHRALHHIAGRHDPAADVTVTMTKQLLGEIFSGVKTFEDAGAEITFDGDAAALLTILGNLDAFESGWGIVLP